MHAKGYMGLQSHYLLNSEKKQQQNKQTITALISFFESSLIVHSLICNSCKCLTKVSKDSKRKIIKNTARKQLTDDILQVLD